MIQFDCIVQGKQIPESTLAELESGLKRVAASVLGAAAGDVNVTFREIPDGAGYRGGELSTTSLVRGSMPPGCDQSVREKLLQDICDMWSELTGCAHDEVVVTAADNNYVSKTY